jgi:hypothetical protein
MVTILRLQWQNLSLKTVLWRVYNSGLGVDDDSVKVLKARIFRLFYNMQRAVFKLAGGVKEEAMGPST